MAQPATVRDYPYPDWCQAAIQAIQPKMAALQTAFMEPDAPVVQLRDECKQTLKSVGLMRAEFLNSRVMGVHYANRYGDMACPPPT